jgi:hypothetical protein
MSRHRRVAKPVVGADAQRRPRLREQFAPKTVL